MYVKTKNVLCRIYIFVCPSTPDPFVLALYLSTTKKKRKITITAKTAGEKERRRGVVTPRALLALPKYIGQKIGLALLSLDAHYSPVTLTFLRLRETD